jgi:ribosomal protein S18 acetylase RimI-like enzyme
MEPKLDNPAWWSLASHHTIFARGTEGVQRYRKGVVPFIACRSAQENMAALDPWMEAGESFFIIGELPVLPPGWIMEHELPCTQMVGPDPVDRTAGGDPADELLAETRGAEPGGEKTVISPLGETDKQDMFALINSVQPGYYEMDTRLLGSYYGIRQAGRLVAMAGERMRLFEFSEISAVCTHPACTGQGYARKLIAHICHLQSKAGIVPFLHTALTNERAIRLYEHMGFTHRRNISFWRIRKNRI